MTEVDSFLFCDVLVTWQHVDIVTIKEAACILEGCDPVTYRHNNNVLPDRVQVMLVAIERGILHKALAPFAALEWGAYGYNNDGPSLVVELTPSTNLSDASTVKIAELRRWCDERKIPHIWCSPLTGETTNDKESFARYPTELRAAIEVFEAVSKDASATDRKSPKTAIMKWLKTNKPELSQGARERIATVANWQPSGGAPKTPAE